MSITMIVARAFDGHVKRAAVFAAVLVTMLASCLFATGTIPSTACPLQVEEAYAAEGDVTTWTAWGDCEWGIDEDGCLWIRPQNGAASGTLSELSSTSISRMPWYWQRASIKSAKVPDGKTIVLPANANYMFSRCSQLASIDLSGFDTSGVTDMYSMFYNCSSLTSLDLSGFDTSSVTDMSSMFAYCYRLLDIDVSGFDTSNVTDMQNMFQNCSSLTSLDVSGFNTSNVRYMYHMFSDCSALTYLDVSKFDISNTGYQSAIFESSYNLGSIKLGNQLIGSLPPIKGISTNNCKWSRNDGAYGPYTSDELKNAYTSEMAGVWVRKYQENTAKITNEIASGNFRGVDWKIEDNVLTIGNGLEQTFDSGLNVSFPWSSYGNSIKRVEFNGIVRASSEGISCNAMFRNLSNVTEINLAGFDTSNVTSMQEMFRGCSSLTTLNLSSFNTSNVTNMGGMFNGCSSLASIDLSGFDTSGVTNMGYMFSGCSSLASLDLSGFDTSGVTNMGSMFYGCSSLASLDVSGFNTSNVRYMSNMFIDCMSLVSLDLSSFDTSRASTMTSMFYKSGINTITLGKCFKFNQITNLDQNGTWTYVEEPDIILSTSELESNYSPEYAGTWIWSGLETSTAIEYDAKGGLLTGQTKIRSFAGPLNVTLPDSATRPGYELIGWSEQPDGGNILAAGSEYSAQIGKTTKLYAQWGKDGQVGYTVRNHVQKLSGDGYDLTETIVYEKKGNPGDTVIVKPRTMSGFVKPAAQEITLSDAGNTTVDFYYDRGMYSIVFHGNGADGGWMGPVTMITGEFQKLAQNLYTNTGKAFLGWNTKEDGSGKDYKDEQVVGNLADVDEIVNLFAKWSEAITPISESTGEYTIRLKGGQSVELVGLPNGTEYEIVETDAGSGWKQETAEGDKGRIATNTTSRARVTNRYSASGTAVIMAKKALDGGKMDGGEFTFELADEHGNVVSRTTNGGAAVGEAADVEFDEIAYTQEGVYTYTIREVAGDDENIEYDATVLDVTVTVVDAGSGNLECSVAFDEGADTFENTVKTGALRVSKEIEGATGVSEDQKFEIDVELAYSNEIKYEDALEFDFGTDEWSSSNLNKDGTRPEDDGTRAPGKSVFKTDNFADDGTKLSDCDNKLYVGKVTVPGAKSLDLSYDYSNPRGYFMIWPGDHVDEITSNTTSSGYAGSEYRWLKYDYKSGEDNKILHDTASLPGDTATIVYQCYPMSETYNGYNEYTNYGLYLTAVDGGTTFETSSYENYMIYAGMIQVPGVDSLTLEIDHSNIRGPLIIYQGTREDVLDLDGTVQTTGSNLPSDIYYSGPWSSDESLSHDTIEVPGDTATVYFYSYRLKPYMSSSYSEWTNYGVHVRASGHMNHEVNGNHATFSLKGDQSVMLTGIPDGTTYKVTEKDVPAGWTQVNSEGTTGTAVADGAVSASFTNRYDTSGAWTPKASKELVGGELADGQYEFEVVDSDGNVVSTGTNLADGTIVFSPVTYSGADHGMTYTYTIREVAGGEGNTAYDSHEETVMVMPYDNGNGTMSVMVSTDGTTFTSEAEAPPAAFSNAKSGDVKSVQVAKSWKSGPFDAAWPDGATVYAVLMADGTEVARATLNADSHTAVFPNLPVERVDGGKIDYTIEEEVVGDVEYEPTITFLGSVDSTDTWVIKNALLKPVELPVTGGDFGTWMLVAAAAAVAVGAIAWRRARRKGEEE